MSSILKSLILCCGVILAALAQSCSDEIKVSNTPDNLPALININITVPSATTVESSRAAEDEESEIKELYLVMYSASERVEILPFNEDNLTTTEIGSGNGLRRYKLTANNVETKSGDYTVYAIANPTHKFCQLLESDLKVSQDELKALLTNCEAQAIQISGDDRMPMSGKCEGTVSIEPITDGTQAVDISLELERLMSRIEFYFQNGNDDVSFTPTSYRVYNVPKHAKLINAGSSTANMLHSDQKEYSASEYFNSDKVTINEDNFSFLMLENVQPYNNSIESNTRREDWEVSNADWKQQTGYDQITTYTPINPEDKTFTYAPQYSTFVVVTGEYNGPVSSDNDNSYNGTLSYTIHLGDFSTNSTNKETTAGPGNYIVNRNELHKYRVTINGINDFVTEANATSLGTQTQAVEGFLTKDNGFFVLDAHYEQLLISLSEDDLADLAKYFENGTLRLSVASPANDFDRVTMYEQGKGVNLTDPDTNQSDEYKIWGWIDPDGNCDFTWILFLAPKEKDVIPRFPGYAYDDNGNFIMDPRFDEELGSRNYLIKLNQEYPEDKSGYYPSSDTNYGTGQEAKLGYLFDFCKKPTDYGYKYTETIDDETVTMYQIAIFVDENVYGKSNPKNAELSLEKWANVTENRQITLHPDKLKISVDQQSVAVDACYFSISQRSIKTPYDLDEIQTLTNPSGTFTSAFGIETWDETSENGTLSYGSKTNTNGGLNVYASFQPSSSDYEGETLPSDEGGTYFSMMVNGREEKIYEYSSSNQGGAYHQLYGRLNTLALHKMGSNKAPKGYWKHAGYNDERPNNNKDSHTWKMVSKGKFTDLNAIQAMMMRNRDLNGNGILDDNEIKWYLPALDQMYTIWLGQTALPGDTRLMDLSWFSSTYLDNMDKVYPKYFTSSGGEQLVYWQDQGTSLSSRANLTADWFQPFHLARAVRNIPDFDTAPQFPVTAGASMKDSNGDNVYSKTEDEYYLIEVNGLNDQYLRTYTITSLYPFHKERDGSDESTGYNNLPKALEVSRGIYTINTTENRNGHTITSSNSANYIGTGGSLMCYSSGTSFRADADIEAAREAVFKTFDLSNERVQTGWRIPNQRELMVLYSNGYLDEYFDSDDLDNTYYLSCTYFSQALSSQNTSSYRAHPFYASGGRMAFRQSIAGNKSLRVRLVRDYTGNRSLTNQNTVSGNGSSYGNDGNLGGIQ